MVMTVGDGDAGGDALPLPLPRRAPRPAGPADAVPITLRTAAGDRSGTALLDAVPPPWLRVPEHPFDPPAPASRAPLRPVDHPPAAHDAPVARPVAATRPMPVSPVGSGSPPSPYRARPRVVEEPGILGLSRLARSRLGSRLFTLFFAAVFALILVQMLVVILYG